MSYAEERLAEIRVAKAANKRKRPMSKLHYKIRFLLRARRQVEAVREKESAIDHYGDDLPEKVLASRRKVEQEWRDIIEKHIRTVLANR